MVDSTATCCPGPSRCPAVCCAVLVQADCLPDPSSVFLFLEDHNIGRDHALFYEAYAAYLELKGNFSQADLVYQEGIKRCACRHCLY